MTAVDGPCFPSDEHAIACGVADIAIQGGRHELYPLHRRGSTRLAGARLQRSKLEGNIQVALPLPGTRRQSSPDLPPTVGSTRQDLNYREILSLLSPHAAGDGSPVRSGDVRDRRLQGQGRRRVLLLLLRLLLQHPGLPVLLVLIDRCCSSAALQSFSKCGGPRRVLDVLA